MYNIMFLLCNNFDVNRVKKTLQKYKNKKQNGHQSAILNRISNKNDVHQ